MRSCSSLSCIDFSTDTDVSAPSIESDVSLTFGLEDFTSSADRPPTGSSDSSSRTS